MTRLILTTGDSAAGGLKQTGLAEIVIPFGFQFAWGMLPSDAEIAMCLRPTDRWLWDPYRKALGEISHETGLIEACEGCETIELWIDPVPSAQLILIWLLDYLRPHKHIVSKLSLIQADRVIGNHRPDELVAWRLPAVKIRSDHLELASLVWQAYRAPTPQDWFDLLGKDTSAFPQLGQAVLELLEELPMRATGLGATEMRMLELIAAGDASPSDVFPGHEKPNRRRVFGYWEVGSLLDDLAHCPAPLVSGIGEGPFTLEMHEDPERHARYKRSRLSLTTLGEAVLAQTEDFSGHNPIHRWWGGTELTNDHLWRWDPASRSLIAP